MDIKNILQKLSKESPNSTLDFTFLKEDQIWGDGALDVMKRYGTKVAPTDLTVILGGYMTGGGDRTSEDDLTCASWFASSSLSGGVRCVNSEGGEDWWHTKGRTISARPALPPSEASKISPSEARTIAGIRVAEHGEYPQTVADERTSEKLERLHDSRSLRPTGKNYTFDSVGLTDYDMPFKATSYQEYEMDGKRYIRVLGRPYDEDSRLSTGELVKEGKPYWVEVQPIEWLMDRSGWMVAKKCLFAGIQFDTKKKYAGDFSKTFMKRYLDTYFAKEMGYKETLFRNMNLEDLRQQLAEVEDLEKIKKTLPPAKAPERLEEAARIARARRSRDILMKAAKKAYCAGDKTLFKKIEEIAKPYKARFEARHEHFLRKVNARHTANLGHDRQD